MRSRATRYVLAALVLTIAPVPARAQDARTATAQQEDVVVTLKKLAAQPAPAGMSPKESADYAAHTQWMETAWERIMVARERASGMATGRTSDVKSPRDVASGQASGKRMAEAPSPAPTEKRQHGVNPRDIVKLVDTFEQEARQFNTLSNASKARHDIAMNAIRNMKG